MTDHAIPDDVAETSALSNAHRLRAACGADLRYAAGIGWLVWDGQRWAADEARARQACEAVSRVRYAECAALARVAGDAMFDAAQSKGATEEVKTKAKQRFELALALLAHARQSQSGRAYREALEHAATFPDIRVDPAAIDAHPYLLAVANGTLELGEYRLREPDRRDLLTRRSAVEFWPEADTSRWEGHLREAMQGDEEALDYLRWFAGYCLCGEATQEKFLFVHGDPRNGKSTLAEALAAGLGKEYATTIGFEAFCRTKWTPSASDLASLRGARFVRTSESSKGTELDEGRICRWVGGEELKACQKYKDPFDFLPFFKIAFTVNVKPRINPDPTETGIWERMVCVPFARPSIPEAQQDPKFKRHWCDPAGGAPAVLAWAASGARDYVRAGRLPPVPDLFRAARDRYREECDLIGRFLKEHVVVDQDPVAWVGCAELAAGLAGWVRDQGEPWGATAQQLADRLGRAPWSARRARRQGSGSSRVRAWVGVRARTEADDQREEDAAEAAYAEALAIADAGYLAAERAAIEAVEAEGDLLLGCRSELLEVLRERAAELRTLNKEKTP